MHIRTLCVVAALLFLAASPAAAQEDWNITGAGARAEGLGGAFIGLADDATAISWNPAGLGQLERSEFSVVGRWIGEEYKHDDPSRPANNYTITQSHFTYNFASIAFPLHLGQASIVPAVAFQRRLDNYENYSINDESYEAGGGVNTLTPGIGVRLHPMLHVGGTVNIWLGNFDNKGVDKTVSPAEGSENNGSYKGLNFTAGVLVDFEGMKTPVPIKLGATVRTPFDLEVEGDYKFTTGTQTDQQGDFKNTVEIPLMYGVGASGRIGDIFTVAVDYESRLYGDKKIFRTTDGDPVDTLDLSVSGKDLNQFRVGAELLLVTSAGVIPLRGGFRTVPTLRANADLAGKRDEQVSGSGFTVGTGFIGGAIAVDVTYSRMTWEQTFAVSTTRSTSNEYVSQTVSASMIIYF